MKQRRRSCYKETQKALMWERWQKSDSLALIAQLFDRNSSSLQGILSRTGRNGRKSTPPESHHVRPGSVAAIQSSARAGVNIHIGLIQFDKRWREVCGHHLSERSGVNGRSIGSC